MWAAIVAFFQGLPALDDIVKKIIGAFTKTPAQTSEQNNSDANADQNNIDKTGRPQ
jgi:Mg2+/Co2+ transporter CorB